MVQITDEVQNKGKGMKRIEDIIRDLQDNSKYTNFRVTGVTEEEEEKEGTEKIFEKTIRKKGTEKSFEKIIVCRLRSNS